MSDKLIIEIDGNASGLTRELRNADSRLNTFNKKVAESNRALNGFQTKLNTTTNAFTRLATSSRTLDTNIKSITRSFATLATSFTRLNNGAVKAAANIAAMGKASGTAATNLTKLATSTSAVNSAMTSMSRRMNALNATVSALNTALRGLTRNIQTHGVTVNVAAQRTRAMTTGLNAVTGASNRASGSFLRLNKQSHGVAEGFRRTVAQITALRTLTYQGLFWFAPLLYSVVKVNAAYEKQMVLLKSVARATGEQAKAQEAAQTRNYLLGKAENNPFSLDQITNSFVKMRVGGIEPTNGSLQTLMDSIASFGGGNAALDRAAVAIQQMGGKGVISMEELRQQLGEHVPTAAKAMAAGMGMSMGELYKAIEKGTVESTTALNKMFVVLRNMHIGDAAKMMQTWDGLIARLGTAWSKFIVKVTTSQGGNSFITKLKDNIEELIKWMNTPAGTNFAISVQNGLAAVLDTVVTLLKLMYEYRDIIVRIATLFAVYWGGRFMLGALIGVTKAMQVGMVAVKAMAVAMMVLSGRTTAAAATQIAFGAATRRSAAALGLFNAAGSVSWRTLGMMALRFTAAAGAAMVLVGAIWAIVSAINAKNAAEGASQRLKAQAMEGGVWESPEVREKERARIEGIRTRRDRGFDYVYDSESKTTRRVAHSQATRDKLTSELQTGISGFNQMTANSNNLSQGNRENTYRENHSKAWNEGIQRQTEARERRLAAGPITPQEQLALEKKTASDRMALGNSEITRLQSALAKSSDPAEKRAITGQIATIREAIAGDGALNLENKFTSKPGEGKGGKKDKGPKTDPAERYRNKFENEFGQTAELTNQFTNLRDNTDVIFDAEQAQEEAQNLTRGKTIEQLKEMIVLEQQKQRELKKTIEVEKAIYDLRDKAAALNSETAQGFTELERGYFSLQDASDAFRASLEREYRSEIATIKARLESGTATAGQIRQYKLLTDAINENVRAKEAAMLLDLAKEAKEKNQEYTDGFLTDKQIAERNGNIEISKYSEALGIANKRVDALPQELIEAARAYKEAEEALKAAGDSASDATKQRLNDEIVVTGKILADKHTELDLAQRAIPYLEERIRILREEQVIRDKWGGAAGPLYDWAKQAKKGIDDLGGSIGNLLVSNIDSFIDSLAEGKIAFGEFVKSMVTGLIKIIIRALIAKAILSALGLGTTPSGDGSVQPYFGTGVGGYGGGVGLGGIGTGIAGMHTGGIVGRNATFTRNVSPSMFSFAKRYHTGGIVGLGSNEVPIIAEKGEGVFTKEQMKAMSQGKQGGSNVQVNVINQTGTDAKVERQPPRFDGEKWVEDIILKKMSQPGPIRNLMNAKKV